MSKKTKKINPANNQNSVDEMLDAFVEHLKSCGYDTFYFVCGNSKTEKASALLDGDTEDVVHMVASMIISHEPMKDIHDYVSSVVDCARHAYRINPALVSSSIPVDEKGNPIFNLPGDGVDEDDNDMPNEFEHYGFES